MLTKKQIDFYHEFGYLGLEGVLNRDEVGDLRRVTDEFVDKSRAVTQNDAVFDLEPGHTAEAPRLRRLKDPIKHHPVYLDTLHHPKILEIVSALIGTYGLRSNGNKLNMKYAQFGSPVEWHQDWAFYPHTNDDLLAVGVCIDPMTMENGALLVIPGSHKGPVLDHHSPSRGVFVGAVTEEGFDAAGAVPILLDAGGISIHHVRALHGSAPNTSPNPRRLLLYQYCAIDAWPLSGYGSWEAFNATIVRGEPTVVARVTNVPVRMPVPSGERGGSIYETQMMMEKRMYEVPGLKAEPATMR
jgi:ectoine hydroxylase-related dioxygenase (phytanoyl-CoA dioxygenase family)